MVTSCAERKATLPLMESTLVRAAGAVLWRPRDDGRIEVAVVHRPHYDDWSLPKGKLEDGEPGPLAAVREVAEETGFSCTLSRFLHQVRYSVSTRRGTVPKAVDYFAASVREGRFVPNDEVDELRWLDLDQARASLSYPHDSRVLDVFDELPADVSTVLLVRHAFAGDPSAWTGDDALRPLDDAGLRQQAALRPLLPLFGPQRAYSAPPVRCVRTIEPTAGDLGIDVSIEPAFSEESYVADPDAGVNRLLRIAAEGTTALVCSQGAVIPDLVARLPRTNGLVLENSESRKGSMWTLTFGREPSDYGTTGIRLVAAHYLRDPESA
jgi:8-oxo-dGTP diphosphatase